MRRAAAAAARLCSCAARLAATPRDRRCRHGGPMQQSARCLWHWQGVLYLTSQVKALKFSRLLFCACAHMRHARLLCAGTTGKTGKTRPRVLQQAAVRTRLLALVLVADPCPVPASCKEVAAAAACSCAALTCSRVYRLSSPPAKTVRGHGRRRAGRDICWFRGSHAQIMTNVVSWVIGAVPRWPAPAMHKGECSYCI